jgi:hypothetical protein
LLGTESNKRLFRHLPYASARARMWAKLS